ncbi:polysialyltransferase family glycosyltransferase [Azohydromonas aeria]|uniref:polysialyltransferase family glycosyltransferase n=1 Tax=Azohydromonas aeria TaxID=2590212 RepID=UPI0012FB418D|nr:polysialyltransferase family glycosyltransferase [Azohydromonas aeria]
MIFFLVNNDYQLLDARHHAGALKREGLASTLIEIPHKLADAPEVAEFAARLRLASPVKLRGPARRWLGYRASAREVANRLDPQATDVLFIYTEFELLNHLVAHRFKRAGARVFIIEDGGVGTYIPFSLPSNEALSTREKIAAAMTRRLPGLRGTQFHKLNGIVFPWLADGQLDGLCTYRPLSIVRKIPVTVLAPPTRQKISPRTGCVIFLNQPLYADYQTDEGYLQGLQQIMQALQAGFDEVLFKFHPRETDEWTTRIRSTLAEQAPRVRIIEETGPVETLLESTRPEAVASFFSTTLLNLDGTGITPIFLYHLLPDLASQTLMRQLTGLLQQWNYRFVTHWEDLRSGYDSGMAAEGDGIRLNLHDLITAAPPVAASQEVN